MSVTFYPHPHPQPLEFTARFWCEEPEATFDSRESAQAAAAQHAQSCQECSAYSPLVSDVAHWPEMNVSQVNAAELLRVLGFVDEPVAGHGVPDPQWSGAQEASTFLGAVLLATAVAVADRGMPAHAFRGSELVTMSAVLSDAPRHAGPGATMVVCGRLPGYLQERLEELREIAQYALDHGLEVVWN